MAKKSKTLSLEEVASKLNVSTRTVQNWITRGLIPKSSIHEKSQRIGRFDLHSLLQRENL